MASWREWGMIVSPSDHLKTRAASWIAWCSPGKTWTPHISPSYREDCAPQSINKSETTLVHPSRHHYHIPVSHRKIWLNGQLKRVRCDRGSFWSPVECPATIHLKTWVATVLSLAGQESQNVETNLGRGIFEYVLHWQCVRDWPWVERLTVWQQ